MRLKDKLHKTWTLRVRRGSFLWRIRRLWWSHWYKKHPSRIKALEDAKPKSDNTIDIIHWP